MTLIHQRASEDLLEKSVGRAALSLVGFDMVFWGCSGGGWICGGAGDCLGGAMGAEPTGGAQCCPRDICGLDGRTGVSLSVLISMSLCLLGSGSGMQ